MKKMKIKVCLMLIFIILASSTSVFAENIRVNDFNEYGFRNSDLQEQMTHELTTEKITTRTFSSPITNKWEDFGFEKNVPLDKRWTVKFSRNFKFKDIDSISIARKNEFIPVHIQESESDSLVVYPQNSFVGDENYSLRVVLNNGKKYKKDFITESEPRNADIEPNNSFIEANKIYLNEKIIGLADKGKDVDYYFFEVPKEGTVDIAFQSLNSTALSVRLYGEEFQKGTLNQLTNSVKGSLSNGIMPGKYYIKVNTYYDSGYSPYTLSLDFEESPTKDDRAGSDFIEAKKIDINDDYEGNVGYKSANNYGNYNDYYFFEVHEEGTVDIDFQSLNSTALSVRLYGEEFQKGTLNQLTNSVKGNLSNGIMPGKYYIKINTYYDSGYSPYTLSLSFEESPTKDDRAGSDFIKAKKIDINDDYEGNVGYKSANNYGNYNDYYFFEVHEEGTVDIDFQSLNSTALSVRLYGEEFQKGTLNQLTNSVKGNLSNGIMPGKYYIKVNTYYDSGYSPYTLSLYFN